MLWVDGGIGRARGVEDRNWVQNTVMVEWVHG